MNQTYRVGIISFMHESNTFAPNTTTFEKFRISRGGVIADNARNGNSGVAGFLEVLDKHGMESVPLVAAGGGAGPTVAADALVRIWQIIKEEIDKAGPLDGLLVAPHGAGVSENQPDMDGWWLGELRKTVGPDVPIICTLDPHCNLSVDMLRATNAVFPYKMNPHLDAKPRAIKAAELMVKVLRGEANPVQKFCAPPLFINIEKQHTESPPVSLLYDECKRAEELPGVLDVSLLIGYQYADVPEMSSGVLVITDGDADLAERTSIELGSKLWESREKYEPTLIEPAQAIEQARNSPRPVCLLDMGDNIGGGSSGQGTWLLHELAKHPDLKTFFCLQDTPAVQAAIAAGVGASVKLSLGGKTIPDQDGQPFTFKGIVKSLPPEQYHDPVVRHGGGSVYTPGPCALLQNEGGNLSIMVTTNRLSPNSPEMIPNCGLDPHSFDIIVAKGVNAPLGSFNEICPTFIKVNTPGVTSADVTHFTYRNRRQPLFPLERDFEFELTSV
jgi:microcystin degradation protein MlrC